MITGFGDQGYEFESTQWVRLFEGEYATAKWLMSQLDAEGIPNRLTFPETHRTSSTVVFIEVMRRWLSQARTVREAEPPETSGSD
jgi:hypothetical protein